MADDQPTQEQWRQVPGFEGSYEVSDAGQVRSLDRQVVTRTGGTRNIQGKTLSPAKTSRGYVTVGLFKDGQVTVRGVHRIVLEAFVGPCPEGMEACHGNDIGTDNRLENLRWGTHLENVRDIAKNNGHYKTNKTSCPHGHLYSGANAAFLRDGTRRCRACLRAQDYIASRPHLRPQRVQIAHEKYREIMGEPA